MTKLSVIYVLDPPGLSRDSIVLLSSIRKLFPAATRPDVEVIAYTPRHKEGFLFPYIREFHAHMGAQIRLFEAEGHYAPAYPHGNKILACAQPRDSAHTLFLDTDMAVVSPDAFDGLLLPQAVSVVPEGVMTWGKAQSAWRYLYDKFGLSFPEDQVVLTRSGVRSVPYFNAGMIAFPTGSDFAEQWLALSKAVDADPAVVEKRPWLDQITLPLAIRASGLEANVCDNRWNLSLVPGRLLQNDPAMMARFTAALDSVAARIIHFHQRRFITGTRYEAVVDAALAEATIFPTLAQMCAPEAGRAARRDFVWLRFIQLKKKPGKTADEQAEYTLIAQEKQAIKQLENNAERHALLAPRSIVTQDV